MCTGIRLVADNKAVVYARTLEFGQNINSNIIIIPRNFPFIGTPPWKNHKGLHWHSRYAVVGANALNINHIIDGVNEKGLAGGLFYFAGFAHYQEVSEQDYANCIAPWELMTWILTNFSTVDEVKKALKTIFVSNTIFEPWNAIPPIHAIVHDPTGNSLVIEYLKGDLFLYENPLGIFTNSPPFEWHLINLGNYLNIKASNTNSITLKDTTIHSLGQGSGMLGLPGDFTPPSRFIRAVAFSQSILVGKNENEALDSAFHLLNLFNIPIGVIQSIEFDKILYDYTQWTSACDLHNKKYYFHTYENSQLQCVDLMKYDMNAKEIQTISIKYEQTIIHI